MSILVNEKTLSEVMTEKQCKSELITLLNEIIDEELTKNEMNTEIVDECVQAILDLESGETVHFSKSFQALVRYCHSNAFSKRILLKRAALIAAVLTIIVSGAFSVSPALAEQAKNAFYSIIEHLGIAAESTDNGKSEIVSIYIKPDEKTDFTVKSEDEINPENVKIIAVDKYDFEKEIPLSECRITREHTDGNHIMIIYSYEGCACSVIYTLEETL
ncbi:MAG: hypothetical protein IJR70_05390 [Eubacterium sp.]|nr:hypothetical protein [Eubacterium sp.]